ESSSGSGSGGGTATPPPALTEEQIESLKVATEQFGVVFNQTTAPTTALQQQYRVGSLAAAACHGLKLPL
ncbi:hypothetical protein ACVPKR_005515, partial [Escherichia coli]